MNIRLELDAYKEVKNLKHVIKTGNISVKERKQYVLLNDILYCLLHLDEPNVWLYILNPLHMKIIPQNQNQNGHMGIEKSLETMRCRYFWSCIRTLLIISVGVFLLKKSSKSWS